jgi:hypothetical protein
MFSLKLTNKKIDIYSSSGLSDKGWVSFSIGPDSYYVYISRDGYSNYWIGKKNKNLSARLSVKYNDNKKMITINRTNKLIFHSEKDYEKIKNKTIYYKYMNENENKIEF